MCEFVCLWCVLGGFCLVKGGGVLCGIYESRRCWRRFFVLVRN